MPTPTYTLIEEQVLGSSAASVTFGSGGTLTQAYKDLVLECVVSASATAYSSLSFNGDNANNYSSTEVYGTGSVAASARQSTTNAIANDPTGASGNPVPVIINIMSYANTNIYKTTISRNSNSGVQVAATVGLWRSTAAITSLTLSTGTANSWASGSTFRLWGIA